MKQKHVRMLIENYIEDKHKDDKFHYCEHCGFETLQHRELRVRPYYWPDDFNWRCLTCGKLWYYRHAEVTKEVKGNKCSKKSSKIKPA